jgi:hypothetical protein
LTVGDLNFQTDVTIVGNLPLVVVSSGTITLNGFIHADGNLSTPGPGGSNMMGAPAAPFGGGGGAGHSVAGGQGGFFLFGMAPGGPAWGTSFVPPWTPWLGGSPGADGATGPSASGAGCAVVALGGGGGGGLQLTAKVAIQGSTGSYIDVSGGGGMGGCYRMTGAGGGGGSGGTVLLEAPLINYAGEIHAEGGGGGGSCGNTSTNDGGPGGEWIPGKATVLGGPCTGTCGSGGSGGSEANPTPGNGAFGTTGAGGGGAPGAIFVRGSNGNVSLGGANFPPPLVRQDLPSVIP